ncbi:hypothetical protein K438DRAFT_1749614 [Mycena galopus ATCC 62051]|nr:hypothetical protein K438DRAFT_1749614 [Mycena galopus ATCC 62051]
MCDARVPALCRQGEESLGRVEGAGTLDRVPSPRNVDPTPPLPPSSQSERPAPDRKIRAPRAHIKQITAEGSLCQPHDGCPPTNPPVTIRVNAGTPVSRPRGKFYYQQVVSRPSKAPRVTFEAIANSFLPQGPGSASLYIPPILTTHSIFVMSNPPTNKRTTRSTRNTPTTNATTLPGGANTPARSAPDAPTNGTPCTPTPAPGRGPSRQGSVAAAADPPPPLPLNEDATASTPHVRSPHPPQVDTLPFSSMVATAAAGLATPATEIEPAAIGSGKGKNKEKVASTPTTELEPAAVGGSNGKGKEKGTSPTPYPPPF